MAAENDLIGFAKLYAKFEAVMGDKEALISELGKLLQNPGQETDTGWINKFIRSPKWIISFKDAGEKTPDTFYIMDLIDCNSSTIIKVLNQYKDKPLFLTINNKTEDLKQLLAKGFEDANFMQNVRQISLEGFDAAALSGYEIINLFQGRKVVSILPKEKLQGEISYGKIFNPSQSTKITLDEVREALKGKATIPILGSDQNYALNFLLQDSSKIVNVKFTNTIETKLLHSVTPAMLLKLSLPYDSVLFSFSYNPNIERISFGELFNNLRIQVLSLQGNSYIDDSFFENHPLLTQQGKFSDLYLDLRGTCVTQEMVELIQEQQPGIIIKYDATMIQKKEMVEIYLKNNVLGNDEKLPSEVLKAILEFKITGYYPIISVETAMDILTANQRLLNFDQKKALDEYCIRCIGLNLTKDNALRVYRFLKSDWNNSNYDPLYTVTVQFIKLHFQSNTPKLREVRNKVCDGMVPSYTLYHTYGVNNFQIPTASAKVPPLEASSTYLANEEDF